MDPKRAEEIARLVALASARDSSEVDLFDAMRGKGIVGDELEAVGSLVPGLLNMTAFVKASNALRSFERDAMEPHLLFSMSHVESVARAARVAAEAAELELLKRELRREDLRIYSAVRLAAIDIERGDVSSALARLRVDADKLRCHETPINNLLQAA